MSDLENGDAMTDESSGALNTRGAGGIGDFRSIFRHTSPFISETVRNRPMVTMER